MPKNNRDNQFFQSSLFGGEEAEVVVDDKLRERQIREEVEIYSKDVVLPQGSIPLSTK